MEGKQGVVSGDKDSNNLSYIKPVSERVHQMKVDMNNLQLDSDKTGADEKGPAKFDKIIGHIEDLLIDEYFVNIQNSFLEAYWTQFEESEENKHVYMEIFLRYTKTLEWHIENYLLKKVPDFKIEQFIEEISIRRSDLDGEVFEVLYTLSDFNAFKEMFLDYRKMKLTGQMDLKDALTVRPVSFIYRQHVSEQ